MPSARSPKSIPKRKTAGTSAMPVLQSADDPVRNLLRESHDAAGATASDRLNRLPSGEAPIWSKQSFDASVFSPRPPEDRHAAREDLCRAQPDSRAGPVRGGAHPEGSQDLGVQPGDGQIGRAHV